MWNKAEDGESQWLPFFVGWHQEATYRLTPPDDFEATLEEAELANEYHLDDAQLYWRRCNIADDCGGDSNLFDREYPISPKHAFRSTGKKVFDYQKVEYQEQNHMMDEPAYRAEIGCTISGDVWFLPDPTGRLYIYDEPGERTCLISADPADAEGDDTCRSVAQIMDADTLEQIAVWEGHIPASEFGDVLAALGRHFNSALVICERNAMGVATIARMTDQLNYHHVYQYLRPADANSAPTWEYGWHTNEKTRPLLIAAYKRALNERILQIRHPQTISETYAFQLNISTAGKKKMSAPRGGFDDHVLSMGIACYVGTERYQWTHKSTMFQKKPEKVEIVFKKPYTRRQQLEKLQRQRKRNRFKEVYGRF